MSNLKQVLKVMSENKGTLEMDIQLFSKDIKSYVPWEDEHKMPTKGENIITVLKQDDIIVGFSLLHHNSYGIGLAAEIDYPKIKWKIQWVGINPSYKNQGYGTKIVTWIRDTFTDLKIPILLFAKEAGNKFRVDLWYYKLGAIILWNHALSSNFQGFMSIDQIPKYIQDDDDHNVKDIITFEKEHSNRRICKNSYEDEDWECAWIFKNTETECEDCRRRSSQNPAKDSENG